MSSSPVLPPALTTYSEFSGPYGREEGDTSSKKRGSVDASSENSMSKTNNSESRATLYLDNTEPEAKEALYKEGINVLDKAAPSSLASHQNQHKRTRSDRVASVIAPDDNPASASGATERGIGGDGDPLSPHDAGLNPHGRHGGSQSDLTASDSARYNPANFEASGSGMFGAAHSGSGVHSHHRRTASGISIDLLSIGSAHSKKSRRQSGALRHAIQKKEIPPKPFDTRIQQQTLPTFHPNFGPHSVLSCFFFTAVILILIGALLVVAEDSVTEISVRYDHIHEYGWHLGRNTFQAYTRSETAEFPQKTFTVNDWNNTISTSQQGARTVIRFTVDKDLSGQEVVMYYHLTGFYQNHRTFRNSRSLRQMAGSDVILADLVPCSPLRSPGDVSPGSERKITIAGTEYEMSQIQYAPCGLGAWSLFNDSFEIYRLGDPSASSSATLTNEEALQGYFPESDISGGPGLLCNTSDFDKLTSEPLSGSNYSSMDGSTSATTAGTPPSCVKSGIAWDVDRETQYSTLPSDNPTYWHQASDLTSADNDYYNNKWYYTEPGHEVPSVLDEDFMVWMRTASLSNFRKKFRLFPNGLTAGTYIVIVREYFDAIGYGGEKKVQLSTKSWVGTQGNLALAIALLVVGSISLVLFATLGVRALVRPANWKKTRDPSDTDLYDLPRD